MTLEDQLPRIQKILKEKIGNLPISALQNEVVMKTAFRRLYQALPNVIRLAVGEEKFVVFCMANREKLVNFGGTVNDKKSGSENIMTNHKLQTTSTNNKMSQTDALPPSKVSDAELLKTATRVFLPTYAPSLILDRGQGAAVWDREGNKYIDLGAGISVNSFGHLDPDLMLALSEQAGKLWHTTNLYLTEPAIKLAENLVNKTFADRVFFCNSGAEANEVAIKIARKYSSLHHGDKNLEKREILTFEGSFHGRTLTTVTATAQPKYQEGFEPLPQGFRYCPFNDFAAAVEMIGPQTCAVMVEPVQGEGGILPAQAGFLKHLREICDQYNALLIFDEIQSGMGRTGKLFGYQWEENVVPDIVTMAKALGGGLPIGAMLCTEKVAQTFKPGDHGTTFGGNPLVTAVAGEAFKKINSPGMLAGVIEKGSLIQKHLDDLNSELHLFEKVRGRGLMLGAVLSKAWQGKAAEMKNFCQEFGVLVLIAGPNVLRFLPALNISSEELESGLDRVSQALRAFYAKQLSEKE